MLSALNINSFSVYGPLPNIMDRLTELCCINELPCSLDLFNMLSGSSTTLNFHDVYFVS